MRHRLPASATLCRIKTSPQPPPQRPRISNRNAPPNPPQAPAIRDNLDPAPFPPHRTARTVTSVSLPSSRTEITVKSDTRRMILQSEPLQERAARLVCITFHTQRMQDIARSKSQLSLSPLSLQQSLSTKGPSAHRHARTKA